MGVVNPAVYERLKKLREAETTYLHESGWTDVGCARFKHPLEDELVHRGVRFHDEPRTYPRLEAVAIQRGMDSNVVALTYEDRMSLVRVLTSEIALPGRGEYTLPAECVFVRGMMEFVYENDRKVRLTDVGKYVALEVYLTFLNTGGLP